MCVTGNKYMTQIAVGATRLQQQLLQFSAAVAARQINDGIKIKWPAHTLYRIKCTVTVTVTATVGSVLLSLPSN